MRITVVAVLLLIGGLLMAGAGAGAVDPHAGHPPTGQAAGQQGTPPAVDELGPRVRRVPPPAGADSGMYSLAVDAAGRAFLSWIEPQQEGVSALRFARFAHGRWAGARDIARGDNWFVNWADHPSLAVLPDGALVAHWLVTNGDREGSYGYGVRVAHSRDGGVTWRQLFTAGEDNTSGYSGFLTFLPDASGFSAAYLTPLPQRPGDHVMGLKIARFDRQGALQSHLVADADTCTCCTTSMVTTAEGPIVAYRDHKAGEIRDISVVRLTNGRWSAPVTVHDDGWRINACPTNGPVLAAAGARVAIAWFTAAGNVGRVRAAFSHDSGARFHAPAAIDEGHPVGWPSIVLLDDGSAVVAWLESRGGGVGEIRMRRVGADGRVGAAVRVATAAAGRSAGIPQMVRVGDELLVAWRQGRVTAALAPIPGW